MNDPAHVLAEGHGLLIRVLALLPDRTVPDRPVYVELIHDSPARDWFAITLEQLRWLAEGGAAEALAALDQPAPATEGETP